MERFLSDLSNIVRMPLAQRVRKRCQTAASHMGSRGQFGMPSLCVKLTHACTYQVFQLMTVQGTPHRHRIVSYFFPQAHQQIQKYVMGRHSPKTY